jgi:hypothetical protein
MENEWVSRVRNEFSTEGGVDTVIALIMVDVDVDAGNVVSLCRSDFLHNPKIAPHISSLAIFRAFGFEKFDQGGRKAHNSWQGQLLAVVLSRDGPTKFGEGFAYPWCK